MFVNISRSKLLINNRSYSGKNGKKSGGGSSVRCNHCGGLTRKNEGFIACIMCSRDIEHQCSTCTYLAPKNSLENKKKSA